LSNERRSVKLETEPNAPLNITTRVLNIELETLNAPEKDLPHETCFAKLDTEPKEALKNLARLLASEPARPRTQERDLARPLVSEPTKVSEPDRDLNSENCSAKPEPRESEPDRDLSNES